MSDTTEVVRQITKNLRDLSVVMELDGASTHIINRLDRECDSLMVIVEEERAMSNRVFSRLQGAGNSKP